MKTIPSSLKMTTIAATLLVLISLLLLTRSAAGSSVNLTQNWGFEEGFAPNGVGLGWNPFVLSGNVTFANTIEYFGPGAEHTEGETSQLIISDEAFVAGLFQDFALTVMYATTKEPYLAILQASETPTRVQLQK